MPRASSVARRARGNTRAYALVGPVARTCMAIRRADARCALRPPWPYSPCLQDDLALWSILSPMQSEDRSCACEACSPFLLHSARASLAPVYCSDDLAIASTLSHERNLT